MQVDLQGRVGNTNLPVGRPLLPLFEAIINAMHAIEDAGNKTGLITISVKRDDKQLLIAPEQKKTHRPIVGFLIEDNGIGFNAQQFTSFCTSDTTLKKSRGAKGIGRFIWLRAFSDVLVSSVFDENGKRRRRSFLFALPNGIVEESLADIDAEIKTTVALRGFAAKYEENCPKKPRTIAERILEHCLIYFLNPNCPKAILVDDDAEGQLNLNELFKSLKKETSTEVFVVAGQSFEMNHVRLYAGDGIEHSIHLCGHGRNVKSITLEGRIPFLQAKLKDENGDSFTYFAYLKSPYLDERVNPERTDFDLPKRDELRTESEPVEEDITKAALETARRHLEPYLQSYREEMKKRIEAVVRERMPELRPILPSIGPFLDELPSAMDDSALMLKLNEVQFRLEQEAKQNGVAIASKGPADYKDLDEYKRERAKYAARLNAQTMARLAQYIVQRRAYLALFEEKLGQKDGQYSLEEEIHGLIFPRKETSSSVPYEGHNLWVVDERLSYHHYLASDLPLRKISDSESSERPDIVIFQTALGFAETVTATDPINSVAIIEFKRPERQRYSEDPIRQVYRYITSLRDRKIKTDNGRTVAVQDTTHYYGYIICDINDEIQRFAEEAGYTRTPDGRGYFGLNKNYNVYVEIISFDKLLSDAQKRNRILFDKLGLLP